MVKWTQELAKMLLGADDSSSVKLAKDMDTFFTTLEPQDAVGSLQTLEMHLMRVREQPSRRSGTWPVLFSAP